MIPDKERYTLCVSTQVGCRMNCQFCATGKQGLKRNLTTNEILNIIRSIDEFSLLTNVVYMGMGEPLDNYDNLMRSLEVLTSPWGMAWSGKRITVSTCGFLPKLKDFLDNTNVHLAISLHNIIPSERKEIMPIEKAYGIEEVIELLKQYDWSGQRRLTFEYIVFNNLNNKPHHILTLARELGDLECRVNLIRFHSIPNTIFQSAEQEDMIKFRDSLSAKGIITTIRASRGEDILAACGLLSTKKLLSLPVKN
jgi:23S rRNA (adenine2503-C2)-methyltransferase